MLLDRLEKLQEDKRNSSAYGFLMLLKRLRRVILQDSALLRLEYPDHSASGIRCSKRTFTKDTPRQ